MIHRYTSVLSRWTGLFYRYGYLRSSIERRQGVLKSMIQPEQLQQDIAALPESAQILVAEFVTFLKYRYATPSTHPLPQSSKIRTPGLHQGDDYWMSDDFDAPLPDEFWLGEEA